MKHPKPVLAAFLAAAVFASGGGLAANASWCAKLTLGAAKIAAGMLGLTPLSVVWERNGQPVDLAEDVLNKGDEISFESRIDLSIVGQGVQAGLSVDFTPPAGSMTGVVREVLDRNGHPIGALSGSATPVDSVDFGRITSTSEIAKLDKKTDYVTRFRFTVSDNPIELGMALAKAKLRLQAGGWKAESKNLSLYGFQAETPKMSRIATPNYALDGQGNVWAWSENGELVGTGEGKQYLPKQATKGIKFIDIGVTGKDQPAYDDVAVSDSKCGIGLDENNDLWLLPWKNRPKPVKLEGLGKFTKASYGPIMNTGQVKVVNCDGTVSEKNKYLSGVEKWPTDYVLWANEDIMVNQDGEAWSRVAGRDRQYEGGTYRLGLPVCDKPWKIAGSKDDPIVQVAAPNSLSEYRYLYFVRSKSGKVTYFGQVIHSGDLYSFPTGPNTLTPPDGETWLHIFNWGEYWEGEYYAGGSYYTQYGWTGENAALATSGEIQSNRSSYNVNSGIRMVSGNWLADTKHFIALGVDGRLYVNGLLKEPGGVTSGSKIFMPVGGYKYTPGSLNLKPDNRRIGENPYQDNSDIPPLKHNQKLWTLNNKFGINGKENNKNYTSGQWAPLDGSEKYRFINNYSHYYYDVDNDGAFYSWDTSQDRDNPKLVQFLGRDFVKTTGKIGNEGMYLLDSTGRLYSNDSAAFGGAYTGGLFKYVHIAGDPNIVDVTETDSDTRLAVSDKGDLYGWSTLVPPRKLNVDVDAVKAKFGIQTYSYVWLLTRSGGIKQVNLSKIFDKNPDAPSYVDKGVKDFSVLNGVLYWVDTDGVLWEKKNPTSSPVRVDDTRKYVEISDSAASSLILVDTQGGFYALGSPSVLGTGISKGWLDKPTRMNLGVNYQPLDNTTPPGTLLSADDTDNYLVGYQDGVSMYNRYVNTNEPTKPEAFQNLIYAVDRRGITRDGTLTSLNYDNPEQSTPDEKSQGSKFWFLSQDGVFAIDTNGTLWAEGDGAQDASMGGESAYWGKRFLDKRWKWVAHGSQHSLLVDVKGRLYGLGADSHNESTGRKVKEHNRHALFHIMPDKKFVKAWVGVNNSWALDTNGTLWGWGENWGGVLGAGDGTPHETPVEVFAGKNITQIVASGSYYNYLEVWFLDDTGSIWYTGSNYGRLENSGTGRQQPNTTPQRVAIPKSEKIIQLLPAYHRALSDKGRVWSWGGYADMRTGQDSPIPLPYPELSLPDRQLPQTKPHLATSTAGLMVADRAGKVYGAGSRQYFGRGQLPDGVAMLLTPIPGLNGSSGVFGTYDTGFVTKNQENQWVSIGYGGRGSGSGQYSPDKPETLPNPPAGFHTGFTGYRPTVTGTDGHTYQWDAWNQSSKMSRLYPWMLRLDQIQAANTSGDKTMYVGLDGEGSLYHWENKNGPWTGSGQRDSFQPSQLPVKAKLSQQFKTIALDPKEGDFAAGITKDNKLYVWGGNYNGQLGLGDTSSRDKPTETALPGGKTPKRVYATGKAIYVLATDDTLYAAGYQSTDGELGIGTGNNQTGNIKTFHRVQLPQNAKISEVSVQNSWGAAVTTTGDVYTWGSNSYGQLATGNTNNQPVPVKAKYEN